MFALCLLHFVCLSYFSGEQLSVVWCDPSCQRHEDDPGEGGRSDQLIVAAPVFSVCLALSDRSGAVISHSRSTKQREGKNELLQNGRTRGRQGPGFETPGSFITADLALSHNLVVEVVSASEDKFVHVKHRW